MPNETPEQRIERLRAELNTPRSTTVMPEQDVQARIAKLRQEVATSSKPEPVYEEGQSLMQILAQEVTNVPRRFAANITLAANAGNEERYNQIRQEGVDFGYFGKAKPVGVSGDTRRDIGDIAGTALEGSSYLPVARVPSVLSRFANGSIFKGLISGATVGAESGALFGAGRAKQEGKQPAEIVGDTLLTGLSGAVGGAALGGLGGVVGKAAAAKAFRDNPYSVLKTEWDNFVAESPALKRRADFFKTQRNSDVNAVIARPEVFSQLRPEGGIIKDVTGATSFLKQENDVLMKLNRKLLPEIQPFAQPITKETIRQLAADSISALPAQKEKILAQLKFQLSDFPDELTLQRADMLRALARKAARNAQDIQKDNSVFTALENALRTAIFDTTEQASKRFTTDTGNAFAALRQNIKDNINTVEFLEKYVQGKRVAGGRLGVLFGKTIGAIAGAQGGPLGSLVGAEVGGFLSRISIDAKLGNTAKMKLIRAVSDDPDVVAQIEKILTNIKAFDPFVLPQLGPGALRMPAPAPQSYVKAIDAQKGPVGIDPVTGRFKKTYQSSSPSSQ